MFGETPAHGFYIRHASGIEMNDIRIKVEKADARPCFYLEGVHDATFAQIKRPTDSAKPALVLKAVSDISIRHIKPVQISRSIRRNIGTYN